MGLDLSPPETALNVLGSDLAAKLPPNFFSAGAKQLSQESNFYPPIQPTMWMFDSYSDSRSTTGNSTTLEVPSPGLLLNCTCHPKGGRAHDAFQPKVFFWTSV